MHDVHAEWEGSGSADAVIRPVSIEEPGLVRCERLFVSCYFGLVEAWYRWVDYFDVAERYSRI